MNSGWIVLFSKYANIIKLCEPCKSQKLAMMLFVLFFTFFFFKFWTTEFKGLDELHPFAAF